MSLRLRLAVGLVLLLALGFALFGVAAYSLYAPSQYDALDSQLHGSVGAVSVQLEARAHLQPNGPGGGDHDGDDPPGGRERTTPEPAPPVVLAPGAYAALYGPSGRLLAHLQYSARAAIPVIGRGDLARPTVPGRIVTLSSARGGPQWRAVVAALPDLPGYALVLAAPTTGVTSALHHLVLVEVEVAAVLLAALGLLSLAVLRRGLRPLESIAENARTIATGDLSRRIGPTRGPTEVVQLGVALDTMLGEIEEAFAERAATEAQLRQFLADVSHELRTPLTSIQGFAELFRLRYVEGDKPPMATPHSGLDLDPAALARRIEDEADRMRGLVEDLLLLARLDQRPPHAKEPVDLAVIAADACSGAHATDPARPLQLDAPSPALLVGDPDQLRRAVANLLANAYAHTPPGTPVEVSVRLEGTGAARVAAVEVADHGPGLDAAGLAHAFDRFWQADSARASSGAGLGLSIVAAIAAEHGGDVQVRNGADGGAVFTLRLPVAP